MREVRYFGDKSFGGGKQKKEKENDKKRKKERSMGKARTVSFCVLGGERTQKRKKRRTRPGVNTAGAEKRGIRPPAQREWGESQKEGGPSIHGKTVKKRNTKKALLTQELADFFLFDRVKHPRVPPGGGESKKRGAARTGKVWGKKRM